MEEMLGLGGEGFGKNRTFADAKGAKKIALHMAAKGESTGGDDEDEEEREGSRELTENEIRSREVLERFQKARGESLFEIHRKTGGKYQPCHSLFLYVTCISSVVH